MALTDRQQHFVTLSTLISLADWGRLATAQHAALAAGLTVSELKEILVHLVAYCGFGRSIHGTNTLLEVLREREAQGLTQAPGREATPPTSAESRYARGARVQQLITGQSAEQLHSGFAAFSSRLDVFLKEHLFADTFGSDVLTHAERETVTISSLFATEEPFALGHTLSGFQVGLTEAELRGMAHLVGTLAGERPGQFAAATVDRAVATRAGQ